METTLRRLAARNEDWRASPLERWVGAFGEARLREWAQGAGAGEPKALSLAQLPRAERLEGARSESLALLAPAGESWVWDSRVEGPGALFRVVDLEVGPGAQALALRACRGGLFKEIWRVRLAEGASFELRAAATLGEGEACEISSWVRHEGSGARSMERVFLSLGDGAFGSSVARVEIEPGVMEASAAQLARALHGGRRSRSYLRPWMRIGSESVTASHGAASGPADAEQALYLASRGIGERRAQELLSSAFARQAFDPSHELSDLMIAFLEEAR